MPTPPADRPPARGVLRLLNGADGRVLCLAGDVDEATVHAFTDRYGREPARVDVVDAGSATSLSAPALQLVLDHLDAAGLAGRPVAVHGSPVVQRLLADVRPGAAPPQD
ncbi:hypothetical protein GB931_14360 [Modestobacter sp. I12A-02628]|uniref:STAS domain-containing protein n=1 Tax=Goekera deserti TaxID=2497753 RepID=A0A7K3WHI6_9ACTN|nr:hypothetical protein [Goekera deserti]MPQ99083.1 hypothetical protein [Goekera deserti]NDI47417.1 hypothetical protein [Goekera deserti]NEL55948.1 hypothetical protein [Goekera deserti]